MKINPIIKVAEVKALENYHLEIKFEDGLVKTIYVKPLIGDGKSSELLYKDIFESARVDYGTVVFSNNYDLCPVALRAME